MYAFTKSLASRLVGKGVRVNVVASGPVWTLFNPVDRTDRAAGSMDNFGAATGMQRPARPEELSPARVCLASPVCASYITGIVLPITGSDGP